MLLCVLDHPTQYDVPLWNAMAATGSIETVVWYAMAQPPPDQEMHVQVGWSAAGASCEIRYVDFAAIVRGIYALRGQIHAIVVPGWVSPVTRVVLPIARALGIAVITGTDKNLNDPAPAEPVGTAMTAFHAARVRLFQGFFTTGVLGEQYLVSLGCPRPAIARGLYPIDVDHWQAQKDAPVASAMAARARFRDRAFVLLAVCKLVERESPMDVLRSFAKVRAARKDVALVQVGDGPMRDAYAAEVARLGLEDDVLMAGYVPYRDLPAYFGLADAFVHVAGFEPWGISVLEAMACNVPVVATTSVGAAADLVVHGRTGALCYLEDLDSIADAIAIVAAGNAGGAMGAAALEAVGRFDVKAVGHGLAGLARRLHDEQAGAPSRAGASTGAKVGAATLAHAHLRNRFGRWTT